MRPKTRSSRRTVGLNDYAVRVIREQLVARQPNEFGLVFPSPTGKVWLRDNFNYRVFRPAVDACVNEGRPELGGITFHDLRHSYASLMFAGGAHTKLVQEQLGHTTPRMTLEVYGHLYPGSHRNVAKHLDAVLELSENEAETG